MASPSPFESSSRQGSCTGWVPSSSRRTRPRRSAGWKGRERAMATRHRERPQRLNKEKMPKPGSQRPEGRRRSMLSLGKLATGQAGYYLDQAQGSLSRMRSVSSGVEDYYLGGPEPAGEWMGAGAVALVLKGQVGDVALNCVLAGEHPVTGEPLGRVLAARR